MPLPEGHFRESRARRAPLARRERVLLGVGAALLAALAVGLAISLAVSGGAPRRGCIHVTVQAATGGSTLDRCGAEARELCLAAHRAEDGALGAALVADCRRAHLPTAG